MRPVTRRSLLTFTVLAGGLASASEPEVRLVRVAGPSPGIRLDWTATGGPHEVWRHDRPRDITADGQLVTTTPDSTFIDTTAPAAAYYQVIAVTVACSDDSYEDNDDIDTPYWGPTPLGETLQLCAGDEDWFSTALACGEGGFADVMFDTSLGDIDVEVYGPDRTIIESSSSGTGRESVSFSAVTGGQYWIRVFEAGGGELPYDVDMWLPWEGCIQWDPLEPNDQASRASPGHPTVPGHGDLQLCYEDEDWFAANLSAGSTFQVTLSAAPTTCDSVMSAQLIDTDEVTVLAEARFDEPPLQFPVTTGGRYYVRLFTENQSGDFRWYEVWFEEL